VVATAAIAITAPHARSFVIDGDAFVRDGTLPVQIVSGSMHCFRCVARIAPRMV
jgi:hypothetical protein